ncbi:hypothetical protein LUZ61_012936 [Rhynchospora tenuis]|uniref:non-specific serine/threonine protein kinase n=1 Tax=Rhynchospora tenuis TaxID=198213 RepID=A0AAD6A3T4_9POAL|nr:hypothetical protein LUZ61_012936 [Rhynchospora tenuis]
MKSFLLLLIVQILQSPLIRAQMPGFVNLDCGGTSEHTDDIGLEWIPDNTFAFGERANTSLMYNNKKQYETVRYFPSDERKYCYTLNVTKRLRYLVRATFVYGNFDSSSVFPRFDISLGATYWETVGITNVVTPVMKEIVLLAPSDSLSVCLLNASSGVRFISTIELRQFNGSMYYTLFEAEYFMSLGARVNFGALSNASIRYPDDPFDRIWESDAAHRTNFLIDVAPGTTKISTTKPIIINYGEMPPLKVLQTAVVGNNGTLSYRMYLENFPGNAWAFAFLAEIENLGRNETRLFKALSPWDPPVNDVVVNVEASAGGKFRFYEPGFWNVSLPYITTILLQKTSNSTRGPILNACEFFKYLPINNGSLDATRMASLVSNFPQAKWAQEGGDPCLPTSWTWVQCSSGRQPQIISINLSGTNLSGNIPQQVTRLSGLIELHLDGSSLTGTIPDFSGLSSVQIIHLENNELLGSIPTSLASLPQLKELYVQNNNLSGVIPEGLLKKNIVFNYSGNPNLYVRSKEKSALKTIILSTVGALLLLLVLTILSFYMFKKKYKKQGKTVYFTTGKSNLFSEIDTESAQRFELAEIKDATVDFQKKIGKGGFGSVYYGKLYDGREIAVKVHDTESKQGVREFLNEVTLLSRIHHRNLVSFLGYSHQEDTNILVYEFMHEGTLAEHIRGHPEKKITSWVKRMEIAEDSAKGIEYLHKGCSPTIIHRDLKSSNILLDKDMNAKVSDFGLSKLMDDVSHVSSIKGTIGYLDPEYYAAEQFTEKSDVYSFGVILLELISGHDPISNENLEANSNYIVEWAKDHIENGNIYAIIDPAMEKTYNIQSVWKIAEIALMCVKLRRTERPSISEVLKEIQEAILIEQTGTNSQVESIDITLSNSLGSTPEFEKLNWARTNNAWQTDSFMQPGLR